MSHYLIEVGYTPEALAALIKHPQDRIERVRPVLKKLGGSVETAYFAFGDADLVLIVELPDNLSAAAFSFAVGAGGAVRLFRTTPLLTINEGVQAMRTASEAQYAPPRPTSPTGRLDDTPPGSA